MEIYGLIGGAFQVDILFIQEITSPSRCWDVNLKVDSDHFEKLISTISLLSDLVIDEQKFKLKVEGSDSNLFNLKNESRDWFKGLLENR